MMMLTSQFGAVRMPDGGPASPNAMLMTGLLVTVPGFLMALIGGILWWLVRPEHILRTTHRGELERLREVALHSYIDWLSLLQLDRARRSAEAPTQLHQTIRARTLNLLLELDPVRKRIVIQFLYDIRLICDAQPLDLSGADLRGTDLRGMDLRGAALHGVDLRGAQLYQTRLDGADLRNVQLNPDQLAYIPAAQPGPPQPLPR
jgi:hypothetical protein